MASLQEGAALKTSKDELQDASKYASDIIRGHKTSMSSRASKIGERASMPSELGGLHDEMELLAKWKTRPPVIVPHDYSSEESRRLCALLRHKQACEHQLLQKRADQDEKEKSNRDVNGGVGKPHLAFEQQLLEQAFEKQLLDQRLAKNNVLKEVREERARLKEGLRTNDELLEDVCAFFKAELLSQKQSYEKQLLDTRKANDKILKEVHQQRVRIQEELQNWFGQTGSPRNHRASEPENISARVVGLFEWFYLIYDHFIYCDILMRLYFLIHHATGESAK
jgi:flagellar biosynthesis GTPase FlhF